VGVLAVIFREGKVLFIPVVKINTAYVSVSIVDGRGVLFFPEVPVVIVVAPLVLVGVLSGGPEKAFGKFLPREGNGLRGCGNAKGAAQRHSGNDDKEAEGDIDDWFHDRYPVAGNANDCTASLRSVKDYSPRSFCGGGK
jgi:hypothetical protein